ncbi:hypothetical protein WR25_07388 [Diploscapter pachys]|uniref:mitogen-activated protein kinase kinase n=1 Tax=Diploscapter pachys TaxID=2018661 RepID=A0A2A2J7M2_9BILA|nr:hypothetical protein WR25_07388 [Diploscapter pachys]
MNEIVDDDMNGSSAHENGHCNENGTENDGDKYNLKTTENDKYQLLVLIGSMRNGSEAGCELIELSAEIAKCYEKTIEFFRKICAFNLFESVDEDEADMTKFGKDIIPAIEIEDVEGGFTYLAKKTIKYDAQSESKIRKEIANLSKCSNYENQSEFIVIYYGHSHDIPYEVNIYLEWMDKFSIDKYLPIPIKVLSHVSRSILEGLKVMFDNKIMHRDLKPVNILVNSKGFVKLGDFGISKKLDKSSQQCNTGVGTPIYMAPERLMEGAENDRNVKYGKKSEIWNYGICLWEMCKGDYPYHERGCEFIKEAIKSGIGRYAQEDIQYTPLRDLIVGCPYELGTEQISAEKSGKLVNFPGTRDSSMDRLLVLQAAKLQKYNPLVKRRQVLLQSRRG